MDVGPYISYDIHQGSPQGFLGIGEKSCLIRTWGEGGGITKVGVGGSKKDGEGEGWLTSGRRFFL